MEESKSPWVEADPMQDADFARTASYGLSSYYAEGEHELDDFVGVGRRRTPAVDATKLGRVREKRQTPTPSQNRWAALDADGSRETPEGDESAEAQPTVSTSFGSSQSSGKNLRHRKVHKGSAQSKKQTPEDWQGEKEDFGSRVIGAVSIVIALAIWVLPTISWLMEPPHELSKHGRYATDQYESSLVFLRPLPDSFVDSSTIECALGGKLMRVGEASTVQFDVFLDSRLILGGERGQLQLPKAPSENASEADQRTRIQLDMGTLGMGLHNLTISITSLEVPPRFPLLKNTSLFISSRITNDQ